MNNKITYTKIGDYYIPNLTLEESKFKNYHLGKYGRMRLNYLKNHKKAEYIILFMNNKLDEHLYNTDIECKNQFDILMKQLAERENITEELKANNQMEWVRKMNNIKNSVEEIIFNQFIYCQNNNFYNIKKKPQRCKTHSGVFLIYG